MKQGRTFESSATSPSARFPIEVRKVFRSGLLGFARAQQAVVNCLELLNVLFDSEPAGVLNAFSPHLFRKLIVGNDLAQ